MTPKEKANQIINWASVWISPYHGEEFNGLVRSLERDAVCANAALEKAAALLAEGDCPTNQHDSYDCPRLSKSEQGGQCPIFEERGTVTDEEAANCWLAVLGMEGVEDE